jgi:hypothetical protein
MSRLNWPLSYFAFIILAWMVFVSFAFLVATSLISSHERKTLGPAYIISVYILGCIVIMPLDRWYDEKFRKLEKLRSK